MKPLLVYAIGNPARGDDGLGPALAEQLNYPETTIVYQPSIEDAELIKEYETVLFIDAGYGLEKEFEISSILPDKNAPLFSHGLQLPTLLSLTLELYGHCPTSYLLVLKGENYELGHKMKQLPALTSVIPEIHKHLKAANKLF